MWYGKYTWPPAKNHLQWSYHAPEYVRHGFPCSSVRTMKKHNGCDMVNNLLRSTKMQFAQACLVKRCDTLRQVFRSESEWSWVEIQFKIFVVEAFQKPFGLTCFVRHDLDILDEEVINKTARTYVKFHGEETFKACTTKSKGFPRFLFKQKQTSAAMTPISPTDALMFGLSAPKRTWTCQPLTHVWSCRTSSCLTAKCEMGNVGISISRQNFTCPITKLLKSFGFFKILLG